MHEPTNRGLNDLTCINLTWLFKSFNLKTEVIITVLCNTEIRLIYILKERFSSRLDMISTMSTLYLGGGGDA